MRGGNAQDRRRVRRAAERRTDRGEERFSVAQAEALVADLRVQANAPEALADIAALAHSVTFGVIGGTFDLGERDEAWDGPAAEKSYTLPGDADHFMWKNPDGDPAAKASYKFPFVADGHAVWKAITAIAAILQGGRGGTDIPDADQAAIRTKVGSYYAKAAKKYGDDSIKAPWDESAANEVEELGGKPNPATKPDRRLKENKGKAEAEVETQPEVLALERLDAALPRLFAVGDVIWGPEEGFIDLLCDVNDALRPDSDEGAEPAEMVSYGPRAVDVSVKLDKVLLSTDDGMMVAPLMIGKDGEPVVGDPGTWKPAESALVESAPDEPAATSANAAAVRFTLSNITLGTFEPEVMLPDAHKPGAKLPRRNVSPKAPEPQMAPGGPTAWEALFLPEGALTDDGRAFAPGSITWRDLPLSLMAMTETSAQGGHDGAEIAGRIDRIWRDGNQIKASGVFDDGEYGAEIARMVADGTLRGLSVDTAIHEYEVGPRADYFNEDGDWIANLEAAEDGGEEKDLVDLLFGDDDDRIFVVTKAVIGMATVCPFPAFAEANISLAASGAVWSYTHQGGFIVTRQKPTAIVAGAAVAEAEPLPRVAPDMTAFEAGTEPIEDEDGLTAGAAGLVPLQPPAEWFENPALEELTPLTVTDDGRIFGHAWAWDSCHLSFPDSCVVAPHSQTENSYFHLGEIECDNGETVAVGKITLDTGHAGPRASRTQAAAHYDHTGTVAAHVRCGEDEFGGWVAGAINPDLSEEKLRILRGAALSGDWRSVRMASGQGNLELVALLAVNVPGFPVPRQPKSIVASVGGVMETLALTAAGIVTERSLEESALDDIAALAQSVQPCQDCPEAA